MNYAALSAAIQNFTQNVESTFVASIPTFVKTAERRIYNTAKLPFFRKTQIATLAPGVSNLITPSDFLSPYSLSLTVSGEIRFLDSMSPELVDAVFPTATQGTPRVYAIQDNDQFILKPVPDTTYPIRMQYFYYPETIVTASTTWLGDNFDQVLLYGALIEAYIFMKGEADVLAMYETKYKENLAQLVDFAQNHATIDGLRTPPESK